MKTNIQETLENSLSDDETIPLADGFEMAFLGVARQFNTPFAVYDRNRCLAILLEQGLDLEAAEEYMSFNTEGAWVGENTPAFLHPAPDEWGENQETLLALMSSKVKIMHTLLSVLVEFVSPQLAQNQQQMNICLEAIEAANNLIINSEKTK
jgi:hypothetical protein